LLELAKEIFNQAASFIEVFVVRARLFAVGLCGNDRFYLGVAQGFDHPLVGVVGLVCKQRVRLKPRQKRVGALEIMCLSGREMEARRIAQRVYRRVDFRAQSAFTAADRLVFAVFFCAPALC
jgi:hypothetical protein